MRELGLIVLGYRRCYEIGAVVSRSTSPICKLISMLGNPYIEEGYRILFIPGVLSSYGVTVKLREEASR